jgi:hypothetical protein
MACAVFLAIRGDRRADRSAHAASHDCPLAATDFRSDCRTYTTTDRPSKYGLTVDCKKGCTREQRKSE